MMGQPLPRAASLQHVPRGRHRVPGRCGENPQPTARLGPGTGPATTQHLNYAPGARMLNCEAGRSSQGPPVRVLRSARRQLPVRKAPDPRPTASAACLAPSPRLRANQAAALRFLFSQVWMYN